MFFALLFTVALFIIFVSQGPQFSQALDKLPASITHITFVGGAKARPLEHLPSSITHLSFLSESDGSFKYLHALYVALVMLSHSLS